MASDALRLLFELDVDSRAGTAGLLRFRKDVAATIEGVRRAFVQPLTSAVFDKAGVAVQKLAVQSQELANRQERARQSAERLAQANQRLAQSSLQIAAAQLRVPIADAHVKFFRAVQKAAVDADHHVRIFRANQAALAKAPQLDSHVRAFKAIQKGVEDANKHVQFFKANERALAKAPQLDAHVRAFRAIEKEAKHSRAEMERFEAQQRRLERSSQSLSRVLSGVSNTLRQFGSSLSSIGRSLSVAVTAPLLALGAASLKSAKDIDANVNTLKAFTGSAEAAERRLAELIKTSRATPGLTTNLALTLDAYLRTAKATEESIDRVLPAIGRLNAVSKLPDAQRFAQNLVQLVTQNFEKPDLKELVGQSPLAGQLITEIFNVDSPVNSEAIRASAKKLGLTTVDAFFTAFAEAAARNQGLATVTESIGTRFDKILDRVTVALRPLGLAILSAIEPFIEPVSKLIERLGEAFNSLSAPVKTAIIVITGIAAAAGPVMFILGGLATAISGIVAAVGAIGAAVAAVGLPAIAAAVAGITILIAEWAAILVVLGLAWQKNFLNIRGLVGDAASAVTEAFSRIKTVIDEATQRILPTLQSITTKVIGVITELWAKYGDDIVRFAGTAFRFITNVTVIFLTTFGDFVDLVLKLIDGDWRGAWSAFARIVVRALEGIDLALQKLTAVILRAFLRLNQIIVAQGVLLAVAAQQLAAKFIAALVSALIKADKVIRNALIDMLISAVSGMDLTTVGAIAAGKFLAAFRKAASEAPSIPIKVQTEAVGADVGFTGGIARPKKTGTTTDEKGDKGADAAARRRIRILELEADKVRTLTDAQLAREQIAFDERKKSLEDYTNAQIEAAGDVLLAQLAIYKQEREEAKKIRNESARDLALAEIGQKEFEAQQAFTTKVAQLEANRRKEELEAAKEHRQALLELNEQADAAELARLDDLRQQGALTAFDVANRQAEIESDARRRHREELELQLKETDQNKEDRQKIQDELDQFIADSATANEAAERRKREALQETADAYRDYKLAIQEALQATSDAIQSAASIALSRLNARVFLTQQQRIERQFAFEQKAIEAERRASDLRIDNAEREAVAKAKTAGDYEQKALEIEKTFNNQRLAEQLRFDEELRKLAEERKAALERANPNSTRSLFGDTFADFGQAIRTAAAEAGGAVSNLQVVIGSFGAAAQEHFANASAAAGNFTSILLDGISQINDGLADMLQDWILVGDVGSGALRKLLASTLAYYSRTFLIKALDNIGEGFSNLAKASAAAAAGNLLSAALYKHAAVQNFLSAAKYGIASAATAVAGRFAAGDSFRQKDTASRAVNGGEDPEPRNRTINYGGQGPVESSSQAAREGSGGLLSRREANDRALVQALNNHTTATLELKAELARLKTQPKGVVVADGLNENPAAAGNAVLVHSDSDGEFNERFQRNLGFAR